MADLELVTAPDLELMQSLAQRVTAIRPDQISAGALYGELAWVWGKEHAVYETAWRHRLWFAGADVVGWAWCFLPRQVRRSDGTVSDVTSTFLAYQVRPGHAELVDEVIDWYDAVGAGLERTVSPTSAEDVALRRWAGMATRATWRRSASSATGPSSTSGTLPTWSSRRCRPESGSAPPTMPGRRPWSVLMHGMHLWDAPLIKPRLAL